MDPPSAPPSGSGPDFVKKLHQMLSDSSNDPIVSWSTMGDSFIIWDMTAFSNDILPKYFRHSNFSSFVRQLNKYDFHKVKSSAKSGSSVANWQFQHTDFNKFNVNALENIRRKVSIKREGAELGSAPNAGGAVALAGAGSLDELRKMDDRVKALESANYKLRDEVKQLRVTLDSHHKMYTTIINDQIDIRNRDEMLIGSLKRIIDTLNVQLGAQLPALEIDLPPVTSPLVSQHPQQGPDTDQNDVDQQTRRNTKSGSLSAPQLPQSQPQQPPQQQRHPSTQQVATDQAVAPSQQQPNAVHYTQDERIINRPEGSVLHVLLVEDDEVCITLCEKFLMKYGCTVVVCRDGISAIELVQRVKFDLVLMDIVMPNLDGASATSIIRSFDNDTPIIAMTGNYQREDLVTYHNHGMTDILAKPFSKDDLYLILEKHHIDKLFTTRPPSQSDPNVVSVGDDLALGLEPDQSELLFDNREFKRQRFE